MKKQARLLDQTAKETLAPSIVQISLATDSLSLSGLFSSDEQSFTNIVSVDKIHDDTITFA